MCCDHVKHVSSPGRCDTRTEYICMCVYVIQKLNTSASVCVIVPKKQLM